MDKPNDSGYFPLQYYNDFIKWIYRNNDRISVITYDDLDWGDDFDYENNYPTEWNNWKNNLKNGKIDKEKIYVLIQHDVDTSPEATRIAMEVENEHGFCSNVMLFNRRVNRRHLQKTGELLYDDEGYNYCHEKWQKFQEKGFVFCYHLNAFERSEFSEDAALKIFKEDVTSLRMFFTVKYFSPHGGARSPEGYSNNSLSIPESLSREIRWVANGHTVRFDGVFSDGGPNSPKRDPSNRDLRDFVQTWEKGKRYRIITHPQYYCDPWGVSERLNEAIWYREMQESYRNQKNFWEGVALSNRASSIQTSNSSSYVTKINNFIKNIFRKPRKEKR